MVKTSGEEAPPEGRRRIQTAERFHQVEQLLYVAVAVALAVGGATLFVQVVYRFVQASVVQEQDFTSTILELLDGLLLVFIVTELLHTVRAVIAENVLVSEPFLIVGIVAGIRRVIVISAEAADSVGEERFSDYMLEMGILIGVILALGVTIFLLRHTEHPEPRPSHEPGSGAGM